MGGKIEAMVSDFGGVLTTPLIESFLAFQNETGIAMEQLGEAMQRIAEREGDHPLFELETGAISESDFLSQMAEELTADLGHRPEMHRFSEIYFEALKPNEPMIELMREFRNGGLRMALLTNNVKEWEPLWRSMLPVDQIFEIVVDSAFVSCRKPDPEIYEIVLERLGLPAAACAFVDDVEVNCDSARELGFSAVHFQANHQAIAELRELTRVGS
jgi:putative hydrolase of the HAD superfamily